MPEMPDRVGLRRRDPGMLKTAAMASFASPARRMLTSRPLPTLAPPVLLLLQYDVCISEEASCQLAMALSEDATKQPKPTTSVAAANGSQSVI